MKPNAVTIIIALSISFLIAYGFYTFWGGIEGSKLHYATTTFALIFSAITLVNAIGINYETSRITAVIRTVSGVSFFIGLVTLAIISMLSDSLPTLVIVMGILTLLFVVVLYAISKSGQ